jgi:hypothetical protein
VAVADGSKKKKNPPKRSFPPLLAHCQLVTPPQKKTVCFSIKNCSKTPKTHNFNSHKAPRFHIHAAIPIKIIRKQYVKIRENRGRLMIFKDIFKGVFGQFLYVSMFKSAFPKQ